MSKKEASFVDLYLNGQVQADAIDDAISAWHRGSGSEPLHVYLGMSEDEYDIWLRDPEVLPLLAVARKEHRDLAEVAESPASKTRMPRSSNRIKVQAPRRNSKKLRKAD